MLEGRQSILFLLLLKWFYVLTTTNSKESDDEFMGGKRRRMKQLLQGYILTAISDALFDIYQYKQVAKVPWKALEVKYLFNDASPKKKYY